MANKYIKEYKSNPKGDIAIAFVKTVRDYLIAKVPSLESQQVYASNIAYAICANITISNSCKTLTLDPNDPVVGTLAQAIEGCSGYYSFLQKDEDAFSFGFSGTYAVVRALHLEEFLKDHFNRERDLSERSKEVVEALVDVYLRDFDLSDDIDLIELFEPYRGFSHTFQEATGGTLMGICAEPICSDIAKYYPEVTVSNKDIEKRLSVSNTFKKIFDKSKDTELGMEF